MIIIFYLIIRLNYVRFRLRLTCPGSIMSLYVPAFHVTPVDLCIIFQCNLQNYILYQIVSNNDIIYIFYLFLYRLLNKWTDHWWLVKDVNITMDHEKKIDHPF